MSARRWAYTVTMPAKSVATLDWMAEHGYDSNFRALATILDDENHLSVEFGLTESEAWVFAGNVESDGHTFLACNADENLSAALFGLLERIV